MKQPLDDYSLFEYCLNQLEAGKDLDSILAHFPDKADKIRPLLNAALKARRTGTPMRIPASAQVDSRTRFLAEASRIQGTQHRAAMPRFRFATMAAIILVMFLAGLVGTGITSAKAIPGDALYGVKRAVEQAQLALTTDQIARLSLEEKFDRRRVIETERLSQSGYSGSVKLAGPLVAHDDQTWSVGGVQLSLTDEQETIAESLKGSYIEVEGSVEPGDGLAVGQMELRLFNITGTIESINGSEWRVNGVTVKIMETTKITGQPAVGKKVEMTTLHNESEKYLALSVKVKGRNSGENNGQEKNEGSKAPVPTGTEPDEDASQVSPEESPEMKTTETPKPNEDHEDSKSPTPPSGTEEEERLTPTPG